MRYIFIHLGQAPFVTQDFPSLEVLEKWAQEQFHYHATDKWEDIPEYYRERMALPLGSGNGMTADWPIARQMSKSADWYAGPVDVLGASPQLDALLNNKSVVDFIETALDLSWSHTLHTDQYIPGNFAIQNFIRNAFLLPTLHAEDLADAVLGPEVLPTILSLVGLPKETFEDIWLEAKPGFLKISKDLEIMSGPDRAGIYMPDKWIFQRFGQGWVASFEGKEKEMLYWTWTHSAGWVFAESGDPVFFLKFML